MNRSTTFNLLQDTSTTANCGFQSSFITGDAEKNHKDRRISGLPAQFTIMLAVRN